MKKFIYTIMFFAGFAAIIASCIFPIFKIDSEKAYKYDTDLYIQLTEDADLYTKFETYKTMDDATKKQFESDYNKYSYEIYSAMNVDKETYYSVNKWTVVLRIYENVLGLTGSTLLNESSSDETIETTYNTCIDIKKAAYNAVDPTLDNDTLAREFCEDLKDQYITADLTSIKNDVDAELVIASASYLPENYLSLNAEEQAVALEKAKKEYISYCVACEYAKYMLYSDDASLSAEAKVSLINGILKNGVGFKDLVDAWKRVGTVYKTAWDSVAEGKLAEKVQACVNAFDASTLIGVSLIVALFIIVGLTFIFAGIKGMIGKHRPKTFIRSALFALLAVVFVFNEKFIHPTYLLNFSQLGIHLLGKILLIKQAELGVIVPGFVFALCVVITVLGWMCNWDKKAK